MSRRVLRKKKKKNKYPKAGLLIFGALAIIYLGIAAYFGNRFLPGTVIGDVPCGGKTLDEIRGVIAEQSSAYTLLIKGRGGLTDTLYSSDIDLTFKLDDTLSDVKNSQNSLLWITSLWKTADHQMAMETSFDENKLEEKLKTMSFFDTSRNGSVASGVSEADDNNNNQAVPLSADLGGVNNTPDINRTKEAVRFAIESLLEVLDLELAGCYSSGITYEDPVVETDPFEEKVKSYTSASITYDWHGITEVIDEKLIDSWLKKNETAGTVELDEAAVAEYVKSLSKKYDRFGSPRTFHTSRGEDRKIDVVCYGWRVNRDKEAKALIDDIKNGRVVSREPEYLYTAFNKGEDDIGDSYVEIDLEHQHLYLYMQGRKVLESDFVSGNISKGFDTPDGIYPITYKERDATLNGQGYSSPVKYWMPFNGNVGMHDASWRSDFGGDIYLRNGSHGCVNLPTKSAEKIFEYVSKGFPVIVYGGAEGRKKLPQTAPEPVPDPGAEDGVPEVDPEALLQMQQMLLLQQQQLEELQQQGIDPSQTAPPAGVDAPPQDAVPEVQPQEQSPPAQ